MERRYARVLRTLAIAVARFRAKPVPTIAQQVRNGHMELREFVSETIKQIASGVKDAQATHDQHGAFVNPHLSTSAELAVKHGILIASGSAAQLVQFDIALTVTEGTGTRGGIGVFAGVLSLGSSGQSSSDNSSISRVKFFVPLVLPEGNGP